MMYEVELEDGQSFWMEVDLTQASSPIWASFGEDPYEKDRWQVTPYQCADARHCRVRAARMLAAYFKAGPDDCTKVLDVHDVYDPDAEEQEVEA
jgi:hypothetical protein